MGWREWPLIIFTVVAQSALGAFWWYCLALLAAGLSAEHAARLTAFSPAIWGMIILAFVAAGFHLGRPLRAINASFRLGRAHFSNEVVSGSAFVGLVMLWWLMSLLEIGPPALRLFVLVLALLVSFVFVTSMTLFYMMRTVPTWNTLITPASYLITVALGGSTVAATLFSATGIAFPGFLVAGPAVLAMLGLVAALTVTLWQSAWLSSVRSTIKKATDLSPHYAALMATRFLFLFAAVSIWLFSVSFAHGLAVPAGIACSILVICGELIGRGVHFGLYMTVGLR